MISQREAMRLRKRVEQLEGAIRNQRASWARSYVGGIHLGSVSIERHWMAGRIEAARMLGHAVVVIESSDGVLQFHALPKKVEEI